MLVSQFQSPNYFLLASLEDYRTDPARAQPLLTISIFDDMAETKGVALVRCDVINNGIDEDEGLKICKCLLDDYADEGDFQIVHTFNKMPDAFDLDAFVREKERRWKA
jgi:ATP synthase F1 complex assembly factor 1